jgi:hypothetical protein
MRKKNPGGPEVHRAARRKGRLHNGLGKKRQETIGSEPVYVVEPTGSVQEQTFEERFATRDHIFNELLERGCPENLVDAVKYFRPRARV